MEIEGEYKLLDGVPEERPDWEIRPDEDVLWYDRFAHYLKMGATRTVMGAYRSWSEKNGNEPSKYPPQKWYEQYHASDWEIRARSYDYYLRELDRQDDAEARKQAKEVRRDLLNKVKAKLSNVIDEWEPDLDQLTWEDIIESLKVLLEQSRSEFGDTEPQKQVAVNVHANGAKAFEDAVMQVYGE